MVLIKCFSFAAQFILAIVEAGPGPSAGQFNLMDGSGGCFRSPLPRLKHSLALVATSASEWIGKKYP